MSELSGFIYIKSQKLNFEASKVQNVRLVPIVNIIMQNCAKITVDVNEGFFLQEIEIKHVLSNSFSRVFEIPDQQSTTCFCVESLN